MNRIVTNRSPRRSSWEALPLRLIVGYGFLVHGLAKLSRGPDAFADVLAALGVPAPHPMAWATIAVEVLGGLAVLAGGFVRLASLPMAVVLLVALFTVHLRFGFSSIKLLGVTPAGARFGPPGTETALLYLACLAALVLGGPGPLSVDGARGRRKAQSDVETSRNAFVDQGPAARDVPDGRRRRR